ncbi:MAG: helicase-related protein [Prosthecobacter sp.]|uniref:helicase-related protein n=1 Tax=Prosthecobacter sp. TaxID=1965333 RepID=UPI003BB0BA62
MPQTLSRQPGTLVRIRERDWVVQPSDDADLLMIKPLGGSDEELTGVFLPLAEGADTPRDAEFPCPGAEDLGDFARARHLHDAARLAFRSGAGPFRSLAKISFRPRSYQMVPLVMALRQETVRLLVADDVGVGKTIEALLIVRELLDRRKIRRFAVVCLPHLCDQWQQEIRDKIGVEAVVIRSNTQARLDREIQGDTSVYQFYPFQVLSIDYIKSDARRATFINECPELVIVDEVHSCARPQGAAASQMQRHALVKDIAAKQGQHLIMLSATPHSGKPEEFGSLLGLLDPTFENLDVATASQPERQRLARQFIQRRRQDVERWMNEDTPFPKRDSGEFDYDLSKPYLAFFDKVLDFARNLVAGDESPERQKRVHYWTALGLLRGVMSSPAAGAAMFRARRSKLGDELAPGADEDESSPIHDHPEGHESDLAPVEVVESTGWSESQQRRMREFEKELAALTGPKFDHKLEAARMIIEDWLNQGFNPVIFCRYIQTAIYLGEQLAPLLAKKFQKAEVRVVTSEDPDEVRRDRIAAMGDYPQRVLIATDCLSEGINLHEHFTAVLHYDLPWNPNRLEQREGRVDRFGQRAKEVKAYLLFSKDSAVDGVVLDVILRKVREIKKATGINVPFPEDSKSIIDTITQSLLLNPDRKISTRRSDVNQIEFNFEEFDEARKLELEVSDKYKKAADRASQSRSIFAQHAIKADEIEQDLRENDEAIGSPQVVENYVVDGLRSLFGVQIDREKNGYLLYTANLPQSVKTLLPAKSSVKVSFESPTPEDHIYLGRNHPLVEQLCQMTLARSIERYRSRAARTAVIRTNAVQKPTTLLMFRCRNVIEEKRSGGQQLVAEEMLLWGYRGSLEDQDFISSADAHQLLSSAKPVGDLSPDRCARLITDRVAALPELRPAFDALAEERCKHLVDAHERFSSLVEKKRFGVVYPVLPMDVLGIYVLMPAQEN